MYLYYEVYLCTAAHSSYKNDEKREEERTAIAIVYTSLASFFSFLFFTRFDSTRTNTHTHHIHKRAHICELFEFMRLGICTYK